MRTTVTLDPDVERGVAEAMRREDRPFKAIVNDALRRALFGAAPVLPRAEVPVFHTSLLPGFDPARMNQLADELESDAACGALR
ncbi:MAG: antitoxin [Myxococcales bacterium]|nr:antitoxin [Myxococcales bacterium]